MTGLSAELDILADLVAIPSVPGQANQDWLDYVSARLRPLGCRLTQVPSPARDCHGLIASVGPDGPDGIVLSGHVDVVSTDDQNWTSDPFRLRVDKDRFYGRGTTDMKGFVACAIAAVERAARGQLAHPVHLALSADEETTCLSAVSLADHIATALPPVRGVLVGEPTGLAPANRQKHSYTCEVTVTGRAAHAGRPALGVSATALAARLITWIDDRSGPPDSIDASTYSIGTLQGGTASNIIAERCVFEWDIRLSPDETLVNLLSAARSEAARLVAHAPGAKIDIKETARFPGFSTPSEAAFAIECQAASAQGFVPFPAGSEAGIFQAAGMPAIVMGPGDIAQAHVADEFIERDQIIGCRRQLDQLIPKAP